MLMDSEVEKFHRDGAVVVRGFYDVETEIEPLRRRIHEIIWLVAAQHGITLVRGPYDPEQFDDGYSTLIAANRRLGGLVYDAVKQVAQFVRLTSLEKNHDVFRLIRETETIGIAGGGSGIRIDNPGEERFRAPWHQEYPAQFRSLDGIVFWTPLRTVTEALGPVEICLGSHKGGLAPVFEDHGPDGAKSGAYALRLVDEERRINAFERIAPLTGPGDLVLMDFLTIHRSSENRSDRSRWSCQFRYFNFGEETGRSIGWAGSFAAGRSIDHIHPGLLVRA